MMLSTDNLLQNYQAAAAAKIESLAKLSLEGNPAKIEEMALYQIHPSGMTGRTEQPIEPAVGED